MKKVIFILLAVFALSLLVGCSQNNYSDQGTSSNNDSDTYFHEMDPMTIPSSWESVVLTGRVGYLIPSAMQEFKYSLNGGEWIDIDVRSDDGVYQIKLEGLRYGENVLIIKLVNAVGITTKQRMIITRREEG